MYERAAHWFAGCRAVGSRWRTSFSRCAPCKNTSVLSHLKVTAVLGSPPSSSTAQTFPGSPPPSSAPGAALSRGWTAA